MRRYLFRWLRKTFIPAYTLLGIILLITWQPFKEILLYSLMLFGLLVTAIICCYISEKEVEKKYRRDYDV